MLEIGSVIDGKYKILNVLAKGGMGTIYLAMNERANKQWAIKEVRKDVEKDLEVVKQSLVAEKDLLIKLSHPHLPSIVDVIEEQDSFLIVMDYIQGNSLDKNLAEYGALPQESVIKWAKQLCDVLSYLHSRSSPIIYRDMKPANIMLKPDGDVALIDFGAAREFKEKNLADTVCLGTRGYAAPEQFGGSGQTDARTDIYCLGATLYHLVTGKNPCEPPYEIKPIREINPLLSGGLEKIILKCTQRNPDERYQSADELMYALQHYSEIDDIYRKKQKKRLMIFASSVMISIIAAVTACWGYVMAENKKSDNYDFILKTAETVEDYYEAMTIDPTRTEAYEQLLDLLVDDFYIENDELIMLSQLEIGVNYENSSGFTDSMEVLSELKEKNYEGYKTVCYKIGEAILYNYAANEDITRYNEAAKWFVKCKDFQIASLYCEISECFSLINQYSKTSMIQEENITGQYKELWNKILNLKDSITSFKSNDSKAQTLKEVNNMLDSNAAQFLKRGIKKQEMIECLEDMMKKIENIQDSALKDTLNDIRISIQKTIDKINTAEE